MMDALLRVLNRPVIIARAHPSRCVRVAFRWLLAFVWPALHVTDLGTTWALVGMGHPHRTYHEGDPLAAWAPAHGGLAALAVQKALAVGIGVLLVLWGFRWFPRTTLALLVLLCALVGVAVVNNGVLLMRR